MKSLIIDVGNLSIRCLFSSRETISDFRLFKYIYFQTIFSNIKRFTPLEVILATDGKGNWRKKIYSNYKVSRKKYRKESPVDFDKFFKVLEEFNNLMKEYLPFKFIRLPMVEADDIISVLVRKLDSDSKIIVSTDKDFCQLLSCKNTKIWNPINKEYINVEDPHRELLIKILTGDNGDEVPPIRKGIGRKTAEKLANKGIDELKRWLVHENLTKEFRRNNYLVNLFKIPDIIEKEILKQYNNYKLPKPENITDFFYQVKFKYFLEKINMVESILLQLYWQ